MGDHVCTKPISVEGLRAEFDASWLDTPSPLAMGATPITELLINCRTPASKHLCATGRVMAGLPPTYGIPVDTELAGQTKVDMISTRFIDPLQNWWVSEITSTMPDCDLSEDANKLRRALRKGTTLGEPRALEPAHADHPATKAMLECVVDFETIDGMMADKFATVRLLRNRRSLKPKKQRNTIAASEKSAVVREAPGALVPVGLTSPPSVLFHVALYHARDNGLRSEEFLLAGDNTLAELRDRIYCRNAKLGSFPGAGTTFFGIEGVLYTDCPTCSEPPPSPSASADAAVPTSASSSSAPAPSSSGMESLTALLEEDLSEAPAGSTACCNASATVAWNRQALAMRGNHGWGVLQTGSMFTTRMEDLKVRLGAHYVFQHLGQCEHTLVFLDIRFASAEPGYDLLLNRCYPRRIYQMRRARQSCHVCKSRLASIVSIGDRMAATNPALFCVPCYDLSHRTLSGGPIVADNETISYLHD